MRYAIVVGGGTSRRFGDDKLSRKILDKDVFARSAEVFLNVADAVVTVGRRVDGAIYAPSGATRFLSVANGLSALSDAEHGVVAVHDGARPFISRKFVRRLYDCAEKYGSAVPRLPVTDTVWSDIDGKLAQADRNALFTVQTPQVFDIARLRAAYQRAQREYSDESTLFFDVYGDVHFTDGDRSNTKITYPSDLPEYKTGVGFDVHPFERGSGVILGGITIPYAYKLAGHSDADALCHAICDAVLSASDNKDIGHQFPDTDPAYLGADSTQLLARCVRLAAQKGYEVVNVSAVVICQQPKISPYTDQMARVLSRILDVPVSCVNISATTTEHLGALGNGDGIAVSAQALLKRS